MAVPRFVLSLVALALGTSLAAQPTTPLSRGAVVERRLAPGARDEFTLPLDRPAFVLGDVDQRSVDVVVTVLDSTGRVLHTYDGPARGPERFAFAAERGGTYRVRV